MSARQPFLPSRPASRALGISDDQNATPGSLAHGTSSGISGDNLEMGGANRALNISGFKKSAPRAVATTNLISGTVDPDHHAVPNQSQNQSQNQVHSGSARSSFMKAPATRIYAPLPSTPPATTTQDVIMGFTTPEFKTPSLPSPFAKGIGEPAIGQGAISARSSAPTSDSAVSNLFRPMSCRPQEEISAQKRNASSSNPSFFGGAQFPFDGVPNSLDDSGYFSSVSSDQNDLDGDKFVLAKRSDVNPLPAVAGEVVVSRGTMKTHAVGGNLNFDVNFTNPMKRIRPTTPGHDEDIVLIQQHHRPRDPSKRPCVRRGSPYAHDTLPRVSRVEDASGDGTQTFVLPPHIPHPAAAIRGFPGLEYSEGDLARYAEMYEQGSEHWSKATTEEWMTGADDIILKFGEMIDMIKEHMRSKVDLYKSLHTRLVDERSALDQRGKELLDVSQTLVRESGNIGGGLNSNDIDARAF